MKAKREAIKQEVKAKAKVTTVQRQQLTAEEGIAQYIRGKRRREAEEGSAPYQGGSRRWRRTSMEGSCPEQS